MIKLDDFLSKKKEPAQVLDLSKVKITSEEEFKKYFDKIPECKVKPEKISTDSVKIRDKDFSFASQKKDTKHVRDWNYPDPTPPDMRGVKLEDLCPVNIDWKMLTTARPKTKMEEDLFSRLVQLGKLDLKFQDSLKREKLTEWIRKTKNPKSSILEMKVISCKACGEDFCDGSVCSKLTYENFYRPQATTTTQSQNLLLSEKLEEKKEKRKKKKRKKMRKKKARGESKSGRSRRKLGKTSIFNRPLNRGCTRDHSRSAAPVTQRLRRAFSSTRSVSPDQKCCLLPARSKSAPRINFERDILETEFRESEYANNSGFSNTDYSSQSDSESPDFQQKFFSSCLRLSGRRSMLSARVSFIDRNKRRESASNSRSRFVRKCNLQQENRRKTFEDTRFSDSSSPSRSRSTSKRLWEKSYKAPVRASKKHPSTIQLRFEEVLSGPGLHFPKRLMVLTGEISDTKNILQKSQFDFAKEFGKQGTADSFSNAFGRSKTVSGECALKPITIETDSYLKAKGCFARKSETPNEN